MKFRAWDKDNKGYEYFDLGDLDSALEILSSYRNYFWNDYFKEDPLERCLDLKEKNNLEVYEGDILKHSYSNLIYWVVVFQEGSFGIRNVGNDQFFRVNSSLYFIDREIIGNIHENPELLKGN